MTGAGAELLICICGCSSIGSGCGLDMAPIDRLCFPFVVGGIFAPAETGAGTELERQTKSAAVNCISPSMPGVLGLGWG